MTTFVLSFNLRPAVTRRDFWPGYPHLVMHLKYHIIYNFQKTTKFCPVFSIDTQINVIFALLFVNLASFCAVLVAYGLKAVQCSDSFSFLAI